MTLNKQQNFWLDTVGDGSGSDDMAVNGSAEPVIFKHGAHADEHYVITRLMIYLEASANLAAGKYGNLSELTNGILVRINEVSETLDLLDGIPVKNNAQWSAICYDGTPHDYGSGINAVSVRWSFDRSGMPLWLPAGSAFAFEAHIRDDLSTLVRHSFHLQGYLTKTVPKPQFG